MKRGSERTDQRSALSPDEIIGLAIQVADRDGLASVSMRRLARELSVTPMALYWHFDNKDQLLDAMAERVIAAADVPELSDASWERRLTVVLESLINVLRAHRWMGRVAIERMVPFPRYLTVLETLLDATRQAGLDVETGTMLIQHAIQAVVRMVENTPESEQDEGLTEECLARREFLSNLPESDYPNIQAAAAHLTAADPRDYYQVGLAMIVGGIRAVAARV